MFYPAPSSGGGKEKQNPDATTRRGNEETTLFDRVNRTTRPLGCGRHRGQEVVRVPGSLAMGQLATRCPALLGQPNAWRHNVFIAFVPLSRGCGVWDRDKAARRGSHSSSMATRAASSGLHFTAITEGNHHAQDRGSLHR